MAPQVNNLAERDTLLHVIKDPQIDTYQAADPHFKIYVREALIGYQRRCSTIFKGKTRQKPYVTNTTKNFIFKLSLYLN